jgi:hypothetical protein
MICAIFLAADVAAATSTCALFPVVSGRRSDGKEVGNFLRDEAFSGIREWTPGRGDPPVSSSRAAELGVQWAKDTFGQYTSIEANSITLRPAECLQRPGHWYYRVTLKALENGRPVYPIESVIVLMDETIIGPSELERNGPNVVAKGTIAKTPKPDAATLLLSLASPRQLSDPNGRAMFDGPPAKWNLGAEVNKLLLAGQFDELDSRFAQMATQQERLPDGRWTLFVTLAGPTQYWASGADWDQVRQAIDRWRKQSPNSANAALIDAVCWYAYAWEARGTGYAGSVSDKGRELFQLRLSRARRVLEESRSYSGSNPGWHTVMLWIATGQNWPLNEQMQLFRDGAAQAPLFDGLYEAMLIRLSPQWGGSEAAVREFIAAAVKNTETREGQSMHAELYREYARRQHNRHPFKDLEIPWPQMKAGFQDLVRRYPSAWNVNTFASYACQAGDGPTFLALLPEIKKIGGMDQAWMGSYSFRACVETFTTKT